MRRGPPQSFGWMLLEPALAASLGAASLPKRDVWELPDGTLRWWPVGAWIVETRTRKLTWVMPSSLDHAERNVRLPKGARTNER